MKYTCCAQRMGLTRAPLRRWEAPRVPAKEAVELLRPILSRLPHDDQLEAVEADDSLDYLETDKVLYTQSRLPDLDETSAALWIALHLFRATTPEYALLPPTEAPHSVSSTQDILSSSCPATDATIAATLLAHIVESFNWSQLPDLPLDSERRWYGVLFHSVRKAGSENEDFYRADRLAHEEAVRSGGLILYWYGTPHPRTGHNLATCIWTSRAEAIRASRLPLHAFAAKYAGPSYESYELRRYAVVKRKGNCRLQIEAWT